MSTALRFAVPVSVSVPRLTGLTRRLAALSSLHVGAAALTTLVGGLLLAIATTSDPLWWQLHFSQLGIFGDLSSAFFNTTLKVSGMIVVVFAFCVRRDIARLGRGPVRRGAATVAFLCLNCVGVNLALVGCIPLNTDKDLHDKVAGSMVLGFLVLLLSAPLMLNRLGKRMAIGTGIALVWLIASISLFVSATINLALFETISCAAMFAWSGMFTQILASASAKTTRDVVEEVADAAAPAVAHVAPRRRSRSVVAARSRASLRPLGAARALPRPAQTRRIVMTPLSASPLERFLTVLARTERSLSTSDRTGVVASGTVLTSAITRTAPRRGVDGRPSTHVAARHLTANAGEASTAARTHVAARGPAASRSLAISASRAARVGSTGGRRGPSAHSARTLAPRGADGGARSLLR